VAKQICKDCGGAGVIFGWREDWCETCDAMGTITRTGPYRLADGTWSDGVERTARIEMRAFGDANPDRVRVLICPTCFDKPGATVLRRGAAKSIDKCFPTHAEAIAYADKQARTTANGGMSSGIQSPSSISTTLATTIESTSVPATAPS